MRSRNFLTLPNDILASINALMYIGISSNGPERMFMRLMVVNTRAAVKIPANGEGDRLRRKSVDLSGPDAP